MCYILLFNTYPKIIHGLYIQSVMMEPMDINVSTAVVVTVLITLHVTNRPDNVTRDAARDIQTLTAEKVIVLVNSYIFGDKLTYLFTV